MDGQFCIVQHARKEDDVDVKEEASHRVKRPPKAVKARILQKNVSVGKNF